MEDRFGGSLGGGDDKLPEAQIGPAGNGGAFVILGIRRASPPEAPEQPEAPPPLPRLPAAPAPDWQAMDHAAHTPRATRTGGSAAGQLQARAESAASTAVWFGPAGR